jgi:spore maturation protein CgeB
MVYNYDMKIGLLYLNEIKYDDLAYVFVKNDIDCEIIDTGISVDSTDSQDAFKVAGLLRENDISIAITMDFCPAVSDACENCNVMYIAWVYDAPQQALYNRQITNSCNHIFSFDRNQAMSVQELGACDVIHFPLATNVYRNAGLVINEGDERRYGCDISFIGNLYVDDYYDRIYEHSSNTTQLEMDEIIADSKGKWDGTNRIYGKLSTDAVNELTSLCGFNNSGDNEYAMNADDYLAARLFARKLAFWERKEISQRLSGYDYRLYTNSKDVHIDGVNIWPELSYDEELPKAYHLSKINLNITLHSITSGIPLRVFDIMGVGGFMLSNYQPEIEELFKVGKEIESYRNIDELEEKVRFYLSHEDIRLKIALAGYKKVSEKYSYDARFGEMLNHLENR